VNIYVHDRTVTLDEGFVVVFVCACVCVFVCERETHTERDD